MSELTVQTQILRALSGKCKTLTELSTDLDITHRSITNGASPLIKKGLCERVEVGCYRLTREGQKKALDGTEIRSEPNDLMDRLKLLN